MSTKNELIELLSQKMGRFNATVFAKSIQEFKAVEQKRKKLMKKMKECTESTFKEDTDEIVKLISQAIQERAEQGLYDRSSTYV